MIRPVAPGDRSELLRMRMRLWPDSEPEEVDDLLAALEDGATDYTVLVAERRAGKLRGFAEVGLRSSAEGCLSSPVGYLEGIWVDPDARRSAVGRALVRAGEAWAVARGCTEFASDCQLDNEATRAFHQAVGFAEVGRIVCYRRSLSAGAK